MMSGAAEQEPMPSLKSRLAERLREALRAEIVRGRWADHLPGERELSREFQVSRPTLRLALWALEREGLVQVRQGHPCRVLQHHRAAAAPRRPEVVMLRDARMKPDPTSHMLVTDLLRDKLHSQGLGLQIVDALAHGVKDLPRTLTEIDVRYRPSYYVLNSVPPAVHHWFAAHPVPAAILGSRTTDVKLPAMDVDHEATIRHAVHSLLRRGHQRLVMLNVPPTTVGSVRMDEIFLRTCAEARINTASRAVFHSVLRPGPVDSTVRRLLAASPAPTAIIVTDLELLLGLYTTLGELGRVIPRDVSVVCTNYWLIVQFLRPVPTCYGLSWSNIAGRIARLIRNHQQLGMWPHPFWKLMPTFHEGQSVARHPR